MAAVQVQPDLIADHSPDMAAMLPYWQLVDDLNDGIDKMRGGGKVYLPQFPQEKPEDYKFRLSQTEMTNVFSDIIESLASKPFEKPVDLAGDKNKYPEFLKEFIEDVDGAGNSITVFSGDVFEAGIRSAVDWIFIDSPKLDAKKRYTVADKKALNIKPFWTRIIARNVLEVRTEMVGGNERFVYFRYMEPGTPDKVRILTLNGNRVMWTLYAKTDKYDETAKTWYSVIDGGMMEIDEIPIVPFITGRRVGRTYKMKPPMKAAADAQLSLYHKESALKFTDVLAAYPMLAGNGVKQAVDKEGNPISLGIGPMRVLYTGINNDGTVGSWKFVEPNANTLQYLQKRISEAIQNLRELGRQPLTAQSSNLTTVTTAFAAGKSKSSVSAWAGKLKDTLENALRITAKWENIDFSNIDVFVFTEFDTFIEGKDLEQLRAMREDGDLSQETYWEENKRRGVLSDAFSSNEETLRLQRELPGDPGNNG